MRADDLPPTPTPWEMHTGRASSNMYGVEPLNRFLSEPCNTVVFRIIGHGQYQHSENGACINVNIGF
ncbi:hypothetical protein NLG97_g1343 [Lecanicillium saksenae]|uniref:Uncharacterized protein n=1 Tax=Lecanicillium saksenae TaxID=468837 RepID=A0ACC1R5S2_9HYPO|nr:hypothetical protein NLG97_g1343 [Lecanicillium saksenae]